MANRSDIRTRARNYLYEATADLFTDARVNQGISDTFAELPRKGVYLEEIHTTARVVDQLDYSLPSGALKIEKVDVNLGTSAKPDWDEIKGWDNYAGALWLRQRPTDTYDMRIHIRKKFTDLTDDTTATDVPSDQLELVAVGATIKCYQMLIGYLVHAKNWDSVAKPDGIGLPQVQAWIRDLREIYHKMINDQRRFPRPREINMVD